MNLQVQATMQLGGVDIGVGGNTSAVSVTVRKWTHMDAWRVVLVVGWC
jgi:hypothetical protein